MPQKLPSILLFLFLLSLPSCTEEKINVGLGEEIGIALNNSITILDSDSDISFDIKFSKLIENSLCPRDVYCFWAGRFIANLEFNKVTHTLGLLTDSIHGTATYLDYEIELLDGDNNYVRIIVDKK